MTRTWTYRLDHDLGFAPNPFFGRCSLACCKPKIRKHSNIGDVIVGMAGSGKNGLGRIHPRVIYWMQIDETLSFDAYWRDLRFAKKLPRIPGPKMRMVGDRTYRHETGGVDWSAETSMHNIPNGTNGGEVHLEKDTSVDRVLLSTNFTYWGGAGPSLPEHLVELFPKPRGEKCSNDPQLLSELHAFLGLSDARFVLSDPADWDSPKYFI